MSFWSSQKLKQRVRQEELISSYNENRVKHGSYELSLGPEVFTTSDKTKRILKENEQVDIPPGQFCLLISEEIIKVPNDAIGFISIKASIKFRGLVNISGFHADPGFAGRLMFSVYNAGSKHIVLTRTAKESVFLIWFADLDQTTSDPYNGGHQGQENITSPNVMNIHGEVVSPVELDKRLTSLEHHVSVLKTIAITLIGGIILLFLKLIFDDSKIFRPSSVPHSNEERAIKEPNQLLHDKPEVGDPAKNTDVLPPAPPKASE